MLSLFDRGTVFNLDEFSGNNLHYVFFNFRLFQRLPKENYDALMKFMCVLYHIQRFSENNNMNSYNLSICVSPSILWPISQNKSPAPDQMNLTSDTICFLIENYLEIFSAENEYILGSESDIDLYEGQGEDSDSGNDQLIYSYKENMTDEMEDENIFEPDLQTSCAKRNIHTNKFKFGNYDLQSLITQSDSSIGTNESEEKRSNRFEICPIKYFHDEKSISKSSPSSPVSYRRQLNAKPYQFFGKKESTMSNLCSFETGEIFPRHLLKSNKNKRVLSSSTTSAELIEHKRMISDSESTYSDEVVGRKFVRKTNNEFKSKMVMNSTIVKKDIISQPVVHHFATEFYTVPDLIFHSVDRRRQPAAPSYEEHIRKTSKIITGNSSPALRVPGKGKIKQTKETYLQVPPDTEMITEGCEKNLNIEYSQVKTPNKLPSKQLCLLRKKKPVLFENSNMVSREIASCYQKDLFPENQELKDSSSDKVFLDWRNEKHDRNENKSTSVRKTNVYETHFQEVKQIVSRGSAIECLLTQAAWDPDSLIQQKEIKMAKINRNLEKTEATSTVISLLNVGKTSRTHGPFTLFQGCRKVPSPAKSISGVNFTNLQLNRTFLVEPPKKIDQLKNLSGEKLILRKSTVLSSRELKRKNKRLRSEIRKKFNEGRFIYKIGYVTENGNLMHSDDISRAGMLTGTRSRLAALEGKDLKRDSTFRFNNRNKRSIFTTEKKSLQCAYERQGNQNF